MGASSASERPPYRYKLQSKDTCGNYSQLAPYNNSIYISSNGSGVFTWNLYDVEGQTTPVSNFYLQRDDNSTGVWNTIGSVAGTQTTLSDPNFGSYLNGNWRVEADGFNCDVTQRLAMGGYNGTMAAKIKSHSNQANNRATGIKQYGSSKTLNVYPNPSNGIVTIQSLTELGAITIYNALGEVVYKKISKDNTTQLDISQQAPGIYFVNAQGNYMRVVKQ
ncbi:MAG: T9SS type A sorting domain-containing protein [Bacteroidia bacterium]